MPRTVSSISDFGFRISDFCPLPELRGKGTFNGGAWHPDSQRIGVPGILSRTAAPEAGHGDGHGTWR